MNKTVNGNQCTVLWHVDDLKISHVDEAVNESVLASLNDWYGQETPLTVTRGDLHDYLGMTLDYSTDGKVAIRMEDYVDSMLEDVPDDMEGTATTPAGAHLFVVNEKAERLDKANAETFHSVTAKILFLCKRGRPDVQAAVAFLCTRVQEPDVDDYKKLRRVVCYLRETKGLCLTLEADNLQVIKWWVDASFAVHPDMRSHTGGAMSLGKGAVYSTSTRQKLNTKSSTEAELVGVDDVMPMILWTRQFMQGQGYEIRDNILHQDNQSAILLEKNGQQSSTKRTRHLDIRYYFVTDRVRAKELSIVYCPTGDMWADIHTKPLQGAKFAKFRRLILNLQDERPAEVSKHTNPVHYDDGRGTRPNDGGQTNAFEICPQECVRNNLVTREKRSNDASDDGRQAEACASHRSSNELNGSRAQKALSRVNSS
jgi:hypothetical protein